MSKRNLTSTVSALSTTNTNSKKSKHWSLGLIESMKDPKCIVKQTEKVVVIRDKYPKAKCHYLLVPFEDIGSIYKLTSLHISLLEEFGRLYEDLKKNNASLKAGFHAVPSMYRMHMHVISIDMVSPCLKTKVHWNSFTTNFFIPYEDILEELKNNGCIVQALTSEMHKSVMATELVCNQCNFKPKNMPQLKGHLLTHIK